MSVICNMSKEVISFRNDSVVHKVEIVFVIGY